MIGCICITIIVVLLVVACCHVSGNYDDNMDRLREMNKHD